MHALCKWKWLKKNIYLVKLELAVEGSIKKRKRKTKKKWNRGKMPNRERWNKTLFQLRFLFNLTIFRTTTGSLWSGIHLSVFRFWFLFEWKIYRPIYLYRQKITEVKYDKIWNANKDERREKFECVCSTAADGNENGEREKNTTKSNPAHFLQNTQLEIKKQQKSSHLCLYHWIVFFFFHHHHIRQILFCS